MDAVRTMTLDDTRAGQHCAIPVARGIRAGISLASAGDMALSRDRTLPWRTQYLEGLRIGRERLYALRQVHSRRIHVVDGQAAEEMARLEGDGLLTDHPDAVLSVTVADCLPIFLADTRTGAFGVVHSGWRGTGIAAEALALMAARFGSAAADISAVIGPGIGPCCYNVPEDRAEVFLTTYGATTVVRGPDGAPRLDLRAANVELLLRGGVRDISVVADCTSCTPSLGSFRRQGAGAYTLMLAWIGRDPPSA